MDPFLKSLAKKTKDVEKEGAILKNQMTGAEKSLQKMKERNPNMKQEEIQEVFLKKLINLVPLVRLNIFKFVFIYLLNPFSCPS